MTTIEVTRAHIRHGKRGECRNCPIALAVDSHLNRDHYCEVHHDLSILNKHYLFSRVSMPLPASALNFAMDFDYGRPVEPFSFDIDIPTEALNTQQPKELL